jgi:hypothetical protein
MAQWKQSYDVCSNGESESDHFEHLSHRRLDSSRDLPNTMNDSLKRMTINPMYLTFLLQELSLACLQNFFVRGCKHQVSDVFTSQSIVRKLGILIVNDNGFDSPPSSGSICQKLCFTTTIHRTKMGNRLIYSASNSQKTMVLKNDCGVISQTLGNALAFLRTQDNSMAPIVLTTYPKEFTCRRNDRARTHRNLEW